MKFSISYPTYPYKVTQGFGDNPQMYADPKYGGIKGHNGNDSYAPDGHTVYAAHDGKITFAGDDGNGGLGVVIMTNEKYEFEGNDVFFKSISWHLKTGSILVKVGQQVKKGDKIAEADNTGASTGSHLHFGIKPVAQNEDSGAYYNFAQQNGYNGAVSVDQYFDGEFAHRPFGQFKFSKNLKYGDRNNEVKMLQDILKYYQRFPKSQVSTGYYGPITAFAVYQWQTENQKGIDYQSTLDQLQGKSFGPKSRNWMNKYFLP